LLAALREIDGGFLRDSQKGEMVENEEGLRIGRTTGHNLLKSLMDNRRPVSAERRRNPVVGDFEPILRPKTP